MKKIVCAMAAAAGLAGVGGSAWAQPANDSCANAEAAAGYGVFAFDTTGADTDGPGTPCGGGNVFNDVWFAWTAAASEGVEAKICGSTSRDTVLAVYDGAGCPGGDPIACNDDWCGLQSRVTFDAVAGQTYMIRAGSWSDGDTGGGAVTVARYIPGVVNGPVVNPTNGHTYYLLEANSWTNGEAAAVALGGHLATVRDQDENDWIFFNVLNPSGERRRGWIGLSDFGHEGEYTWTSGEPVGYLNWGGGEPNHANGEEWYAQFAWWASTWNDNRDLPGDDPCYPIVEVIEGGGCIADFNGDGFVDFFDYDDFVNCFETAVCPPGKTADVNGDDFVDFFDYDDYVNAFESGC